MLAQHCWRYTRMLLRCKRLLACATAGGRRQSSKRVIESRQVRNKVRHRQSVGSVVLCIGDAGQNRCWRAITSAVRCVGRKVRSSRQLPVSHAFLKPAQAEAHIELAKTLTRSSSCYLHSRHNDSLPIPSINTSHAFCCYSLFCCFDSFTDRPLHRLPHAAQPGPAAATPRSLAFSPSAAQSSLNFACGTRTRPLS
jgi:hypothetical protein